MGRDRAEQGDVAHREPPRWSRPGGGTGPTRWSRDSLAQRHQPLTNVDVFPRLV